MGLVVLKAERQHEKHRVPSLPQSGREAGFPAAWARWHESLAKEPAARPSKEGTAEGLWPAWGAVQASADRDFVKVRSATFMHPPRTRIPPLPPRS